MKKGHRRKKSPTNEAQAAALFLRPVDAWFRREIGSPTRIQTLAWPRIAAGENVLLLAPTGSGKTLAAFLACLDRIWKSPASEKPGVRILYVSPLKALNHDIHRNLSVPLTGVLDQAQQLGETLRPIRTGVRTGDTTPEQRRALNQNPPEILITTPESLHLLLTSAGRENLRHVETVILDEIHSLCPNKRGAFLSLLLERLEALRMGLPGKKIEGVPPMQRIGLSATQKPLDEVARFLGGLMTASEEKNPLLSRPVAILDGGTRKEQDVQIIWPQSDLKPDSSPPESVWPAIHACTKDLVNSHHSTIVFANNRRSAEKITAGINDDPAKPIAQAHHGSISLEKRLAIEDSLKSGNIKAVIATSSLEMGIDMGAVNLVIQVESPGSVSSALQRIGRAGHLVGQVSKGRILPKTDLDLAECATLVPLMAQGDVEPLVVPPNPLDILAQQIVSAVAMDSWPVKELYDCFRKAYPYQNLTTGLFEETLDMVSGRYLQITQNYPSGEETENHDAKIRPRVWAALQPKIHHDRTLGILEALPGTKANAIAGGGAIPDTGNFLVVGPDGSRVGELDEEFVHERRVGDAFLLGTTVWRIGSIEPDRVLVTPSPGSSAVLPFWRGEGPGRSLHVGRAFGSFLKDALDRIDASDRLEWLERNHGLDRQGARHLYGFITRQLIKTGMIPHRQAALVETWRDPLGDWQIAIINLLGSKFNRTLQLALESRYRETLGHQPAIASHDDGVLIRLSDMAGTPENPLNLLQKETLTSDILQSLAGSPLFAIRFRHNAVRALLVQKGAQGRRAPLWLQRLRGKDLYQILGKIPGFPLVNETARECLSDQLEIRALEEWLEEIQAGSITIHLRQADSPSPFCREINWQFTAANMYQPDDVRGEFHQSGLDTERLAEMFGDLGRGGLIPIHPDAISQVDQYIRFQKKPPRSSTELATMLLNLGDLAENECRGVVSTWLHELVERGSVVRFKPSAKTPELFIPAEYLDQYQSAFQKNRIDGDEKRRVEEGTKIILRFLDNHTLVNLDSLCDRYPINREWASQLLEGWAQSGKVLKGKVDGNQSTVDYSMPEKWNQARKISLSIARREFTPVSITHYCQFLFQWQQIKIPGQLNLKDPTIQEIAGKTAFEKWPETIWEKGIIRSRISNPTNQLIDQWSSSGNGVWIGSGADSNQFIPFALFNANQISEFGPPSTAKVSESARSVLNILQEKGPSFGRELIPPVRSDSTSLTESLMELVQAGLVTNDRLSPLREFQKSNRSSPTIQAPVHKRVRLAKLRASYQMEETSLDGRWSAVPWGTPTPEEETLAWTMALLERFGILNKELAVTVPESPTWSNLYKVLDQLELAGEVQRGHFVEGLAGAQFGLPEAVEQLGNIPKGLYSVIGCVVLNALDPANLFGPGRAFELPPDTCGEKRHGINSESWLVFLGGYPIALAQKNGRKIDFFTHNESEIQQALLAIVEKLAPVSKPWLKVDICASQPAGLSPWRDRLEHAGLVADHLAMAYHRS